MTQRSTRHGFWLALLAFGALASSASAQQPTQAQASAIRQACRADYQAHCASVPTGGTASLNCLQQHQSELSPACGSAVAAAGGSAAPVTAAKPPPTTGGTATAPMGPREDAGALRRACGPDFRAYCQGVPLGGGRAIGCLKDNSARLSPSCKGALSAMHG